MKLDSLNVLVLLQCYCVPLYHKLFEQHQQHHSQNMYRQKPIYCCLLFALALYWHLQWDGMKLEEFRTSENQLYPPKISSHHKLFYNLLKFSFCVYIPTMWQNQQFLSPMGGITTNLYSLSVAKPLAYIPTLCLITANLYPYCMVEPLVCAHTVA